MVVFLTSLIYGAIPAPGMGAEGCRDRHGKGGTMKRVVGACVALLLLSAAAHAAERVDGKITAIDAEKGTIEMSGITVLAKGAKVWDLIFPTSLTHLRTGWSMEATGSFSGPRQFTATMIVAKYFMHYEIQAKPDAIDAQARTLSVSGVTVKVPANCEIEDAEGETTTLDKLPVGGMMEIEGNWTASAEFTCYSIEVYKAEKKDEHKEEAKEEK